MIIKFIKDRDSKTLVIKQNPESVELSKINVVVEYDDTFKKAILYDEIEVNKYEIDSEDDIVVEQNESLKVRCLLKLLEVIN